MKPNIRKQDGIAQGVLLIFLAIVTAVLFVLATIVVNSYAKLESELGIQWYDRGTRDLRAGNPEQAVIDLRTALSYSREASYRLELARALLASGRTQEAREYLLSLWERQPGSAELNLELARVSALSQALPAAIGYYDAAISGSWDDSPELNRRSTRLELARFLIAHNEKRRAIAVLTQVADDLPPDAQASTEVGTLLLQAGDAVTARRIFDAALRTTRDYVPAMQGAGAAALALNDFPAAERYLATYLRQQPQDQVAHSQLQLARTALRVDPLAPHLSPPERRRRALALFRDAQQRLNACSSQLGTTPAPDLQNANAKLAAQSANANDRALLRDPDLVLEVFEASSGAIAAASKWCGSSGPNDQAVVALARLHGARP